MEKNHNPFTKDADKTPEQQTDIIEEDNKTNTENSEEKNNETLNDNDNVENDVKNTETQEPENSDESNNLEEKFNVLNNNYIRLAADFDNYRKRTAQEKEALSKFASAEVLKKLTGVLDTFDRAKESLKEIEDCKTVKDSYEVAYKQLTDTLKKLGMEEIEALGQNFDPNLHEAVTQIPTNEYEPDTVAVVMQKGYKMEDRILRPALVGVAKAAQE